jgi:hypothetical protein
MHNAMIAACRRTAGLTAGLLLGAGLAGGVLLTPGTALAGPVVANTVVATATAVTGTTQTPGDHGTALDVQVSVTPASGTVWPAGTVKVSDGSRGCQLTLVQDGSKAAGVGDCHIYGLDAGTYTLTATYEGSSSFGSSASNPASVTIGAAPVFYADSPSLTAVSGQRYSYTFGAKGIPAPGYVLGAGSPGWLHIDSRSGAVWGTAPGWVTSFSYSVTASNGAGSATAGPYLVQVTRPHAAIATQLSCTPKVYAGRQGSCTLSVTNAGRFSAPDVTAAISLPAQLRARYCGQFWAHQGCRISGNTASENLGPLRPGQTRTLTVVFTAKSGPGRWGWQHKHTIKVKVTGFAVSGGGFGGSGAPAARSYSAAYVTIVPQGWWWAF